MKVKQIHGVGNCDQYLALQIGESVLWNRLGFLLESTGGSDFNPVASTAAIFSREFKNLQINRWKRGWTCWKWVNPSSPRARVKRVSSTTTASRRRRDWRSNSWPSQSSAPVIPSPSASHGCGKDQEMRWFIPFILFKTLKVKVDGEEARTIAIDVLKQLIGRLETDQNPMNVIPVAGEAK